MGSLIRGRSALRAVIFDIDGTLAETQRDGHLPAYNAAFSDLHLPFRWSAADYQRLLTTPGGRERLYRFLQEQGVTENAQQLIEALHRVKTRYLLDWIYSARTRPRPGAVELVSQLRHDQVRLAVVTCGSRAWVDPFLQRFFRPTDFETVITRDDVNQLKPAPEMYRVALHRLGLSPRDVLAVESSPAGVQAAASVGIRSLAVTSELTRGQEFPGAAAVVPGYDEQYGDPLLRPYLRDGITPFALTRLHRDPSA